MLNLLFPRNCEACDEVLIHMESVLCVKCRHQLPLISNHKSGNKMMQDKFYGKIPIENATALLQFQKEGITQELLHKLKYQGRKEIGSFFGKWLGAELAEVVEYRKIQGVIPVPLHKQKLRKRGYNQVEGFGKEIAKALEVEYLDNILIKISKTDSQTKKTWLLRYDIAEMFTVQNIEILHNKHVLLVDDIITTGATIEKCAQQLLLAENLTLSVATIAIV